MATDSAPLVSFIVPCYNYGRYLRDCLDSIFRQTGTEDFEVVAIDDCSTDDTLEILRSYRDPRLRVYAHEVNQGHVKTINEGLSLVRGHYVARIDPDDRYRPEFLETVLGIFRKHPEVGVVYGDAAIISSDGELWRPSTDEQHGGKDFKGNELIPLLEKNFICAPTLIARREAWQRAHPVPPGLAFNDWYFNLMMARDWDFYYVHRVLADYRVHGSNHHAMVVRNRSEEPSIFRLLEIVYSSPESDPALEAAKRKARRRIYASQYLDQANKYFYVGYNQDARRCYWRTLCYRPDFALREGVLRRFAATLFGRGAYEALKRILRRSKEARESA